jgi:glutamate-ammonia-ligase adenylyltransferase
MKSSAEDLRRACPETDPRLIEAHLARLSDAYFELFSTDEIAAHLRRITGLTPDRPAGVIMSSDKTTGSISCTILAFDSPGLFSLITGILASLGFSIDSGDVFTYAKDVSSARNKLPDGRKFARKRKRLEGWQRRHIIDHFTGTLPTGNSHEEWGESLSERLAAILGVLEKGSPDAATTARQRVIEQVTEFLVSSHKEENRKMLPVSVEFENEGEAYTRVRVLAQDTPAFLYSLSVALSLHNLSIEHVRIRTEDTQVADELDLVTTGGKAIEDPALLEKIRLSIILTKQFTYFLDRAPDPYNALARFEFLVEEIVKLPDSERWREALSDPHLMQDLARLLGASDYLWEDFVRMQYESLLPSLAAAGAGDAFKEPGESFKERLRRDIAGITDPAEVRRKFNAFKNQEVFHADLEHLLNPEVTFRMFAERLTRLAEAVVTVAIDVLIREAIAIHGPPLTVAGLPASYAVVGLGKFGGAALGYASDIELMFVYSDQGKTGGPNAIPNDEFFNNVVLALCKFIEAKREGILQVDLRLRPHGNSGPPACSLASFLTYYGPGGAAHSAERLALVRLRTVTGDKELGAQIERVRDEFIFSSASIVEAELRELRARQFVEKSEPGRYNVKFGPGGLVDLEYDVQILQVTHGKEVPELRTPRIHIALDELARAGVLEEEESERLNHAYDFLRRLINGLRMLRGSAKDLFLPKIEDEEFLHLARRMGYERNGDLAPETQLRIEFETRTAEVRTFVDKHFGRSSLPDPSTGNVADLVLLNSAPDQLQSSILSAAGFQNTPRAYENIRSIAGRGARRTAFASLSVLASDILGREPEPDMALNNWERFTRELPDPPVHIEMLRAQPKRLEVLLGLFSRSQFLSNTLIRNVQLWDWITEPEVLQHRPDTDSLFRSLDKLSAASDNENEWLAELRRFRKMETLRVGTRDMVLGVPLQETVRSLSALADAVLKVSLQRQWRIDGAAGADRSERFCIFALGKLGGRELNYSSDIDLLGVYDESKNQNDETAFSRTLTRLGTNLSRHTSDGYVYRVDLRLRPWGSGGTVAAPFAAVAEYYRAQASPWEIQALLKLRPIAGATEVGQKMMDLTHEVLARPRDPGVVRSAIADMRQRAVKELLRKGDERIHVKTGEGGIRDIEFVVQGLQLIHAASHDPSLLSGQTLEGIQLLQRAKIITDKCADEMTRDYEFLRRIEHHLQILDDRQTHVIPRDPAELDALAHRVMGRDTTTESFLDALSECRRQVRDRYDRFIAEEDLD